MNGILKLYDFHRFLEGKKVILGADSGNYLSIHGIGGNEISRTSLSSLTEKSSTEEIDISNLRPGVYFLRMNINGTMLTRKLIRN